MRRKCRARSGPTRAGIAAPRRSVGRSGISNGSCWRTISSHDGRPPLKLHCCGSKNTPAPPIRRTPYAPRQIHTLYRPATMQTDAPDLLFVHGAYMDSCCWDIHFWPHFTALGYNCHAALDLTAHGLSEGQDEADRFGIDDYAADLRQASPPARRTLCWSTFDGAAASSSVRSSGPRHAPRCSWSWVADRYAWRPRSTHDRWPEAPR